MRIIKLAQWNWAGEADEMVFTVLFNESIRGSLTDRQHRAVSQGDNLARTILNGAIPDDQGRNDHFLVQNGTLYYDPNGLINNASILSRLRSLDDELRTSLSLPERLIQEDWFEVPFNFIFHGDLFMNSYETSGVIDCPEYITRIAREYEEYVRNYLVTSVGVDEQMVSWRQVAGRGERLFLNQFGSSSTPHHVTELIKIDQDATVDNSSRKFIVL
jgi:hypothetical protein